MITVDANTLATINAVVTRPLVLVEALFSVPIRLATWDDDISFEGKVWMGRKITAIELPALDGSGAGGGSVSIDNTDDMMSALLLNERWTDKTINIIAAWLDGASQCVSVQRWACRGGKASCSQTVMTASYEIGSAAWSRYPATTIRQYVGFPAPRPEGSTVVWNGQVYKLSWRGA